MPAPERITFRRYCRVILFTTYLLIAVGSIVRSTGSGMGCPDWPTCFGQWVPPTSAEQLPTDYQEKYSEYRQKKNQKFAGFLSRIGLEETANKLLNDPNVLREEPFNVAKTWTEYVNRLTGVVLGLMMIALVAFGYSVRKKFPFALYSSLLLLAVTIVQGWFGSIVVSTKLTSWTISVHYLLAIVIVFLLIWMMNQTRDWETITVTSFYKNTLLLSFLVMSIQMISGVHVREEIDGISHAFPKAAWLEQVESAFIMHRSLSYSVLLVGLLIVWKFLNKNTPEHLMVRTRALVILWAINFATGALLVYFNFPFFAQPIHILVATLALGLNFYLVLTTRRIENYA